MAKASHMATAGFLEIKRKIKHGTLLPWQNQGSVNEEEGRMESEQAISSDGSRFCRNWSFYNLEAFFKKNNEGQKITNTKLSTKVNIYLE